MPKPTSPEVKRSILGKKTLEQHFNGIENEIASVNSRLAHIENALRGPVEQTVRELRDSQLKLAEATIQFIEADRQAYREDTRLVKTITQEILTALTTYRKTGNGSCGEHSITDTDALISGIQARIQAIHDA